MTGCYGFRKPERCDCSPLTPGSPHAWLPRLPLPSAGPQRAASGRDEAAGAPSRRLLGRGLPPPLARCQPIPGSLVQDTARLTSVALTVAEERSAGWKGRERGAGRHAETLPRVGRPRQRPARARACFADKARLLPLAWLSVARLAGP